MFSYGLNKQDVVWFSDAGELFLALAVFSHRTHCKGENINNISIISIIFKCQTIPLTAGQAVLDSITKLASSIHYVSLYCFHRVTAPILVFPLNWMFRQSKFTTLGAMHLVHSINNTLLLVRTEGYLKTRGLHATPSIRLTGNLVGLITEKQHLSIWGFCLYFHHRSVALNTGLLKAM